MCVVEYCNHASTTLPSPPPPPHTHTHTAGASLTLGPLLQCAVALPPFRQPLAHSTPPHLHQITIHRTHVRVHTQDVDKHPPPSTFAHTLHSIASCESTSCGTNPSFAESHSRTSTTGMKSDVQVGQVSSSHSANSATIGDSHSSVWDQFHTLSVMHSLPSTSGSESHTPGLVPSMSESHTLVLNPSVSDSHTANLVQSLSNSHSSKLSPPASDTSLPEQVPSVRASHTQSLTVNFSTPTTPPTGVGFPLKYQLILYIVPPVMVVVCCLLCLTLCLCLRRYRK